MYEIDPAHLRQEHDSIDSDTSEESVGQTTRVEGGVEWDVRLSLLLLIYF